MDGLTCRPTTAKRYRASERDGRVGDVANEWELQPTAEQGT